MLNRVLRIDGGGVRYEADPRHAEILAAMLGASTRPVSTPGLRESLGPLAKEEPAEQPEDGKVFSLDGDWDLDAVWGQEEEEERSEEEQWEVAPRPARFSATHGHLCHWWPCAPWALGAGADAG